MSAGSPVREPATAGDQASDLVAAEDRRGAAAFDIHAFRSIVIRWDGGHAGSFKRPVFESGGRVSRLVKNGGDAFYARVL